MKKGKKAFSGILMFLLLLLVSHQASGMPYSSGPGSSGKELLHELLIGPQAFSIRVASNGCTDKNSFSIAAEKGKSISSTMPHYALTINRTKPDNCKAIVAGGIVLSFDLLKDLGINGKFSYMITNPVLSASGDAQPGESMYPAIPRETSLNFATNKAIRQEGFERFVMDHEYFSCSIPSGWNSQRDREKDEKAGIFELILTKPEKAKPEDGAKYFYPEPLIYTAYYSGNNDQEKTYNSLVNEYEELARKSAGSEKTRYNHPEKTTFKNTEATTIYYELYREIPRDPLFATKYRLKAKVFVIKAADGFYVIAYKSPEELFEKYLPLFNAVAESFTPQ